MEKHCDKMSSLLSQLERMGPDVAVPETHKGPLLLASIGPDSGYESTAAALRTKDPSELSFELVSNALIEESRTRYLQRSEKSKSGKPNHKHDKKNRNGGEGFTPAVASVATSNGKGKTTCTCCGIAGHEAKDCFVNPENPKNKLPDSLLQLYKEQKRKATNKKVKVAGVAVHERATEVATAECNISTNTNRAVLLDSGANAHVFGSSHYFSHYTTSSDTSGIGTADGTRSNACGVGSVSIALTEGVDIELSNVLHTPSFAYDLISIPVLTDHGIQGSV